MKTQTLRGVEYQVIDMNNIEPNTQYPIQRVINQVAPGTYVIHNTGSYLATTEDGINFNLVTTDHRAYWLDYIIDDNNNNNRTK